MILTKKPLTIAEAQSFVKNIEEKKPLHNYFKKFSTLSKADAEALLKKLKALNNVKLNDEALVHLVDFAPLDVEDINKILIDVSLSEEEAQAVLAIIRGN